MPVSELKEVVGRISDYRTWGHPEYIRFFAWYLHTFERNDRFVAADIRRCYAALPEDQLTTSTRTYPCGASSWLGG